MLFLNSVPTEQLKFVLRYSLCFITNLEYFGRLVSWKVSCGEIEKIKEAIGKGLNL